MLATASHLLLLAGCVDRSLDDPLIRAARTGDVAQIRRLLAAGADPERPAGVNHWNALMHAIHKNRIGAVEALLDGGAKPNSRSGHLTPLVMAAGYGQAGIVRLLLKKGADPRFTTTNGTTALEAAVSGTPDIDRFTVGDCQTATVQALVEAAPDLKLRDNFKGNLARRVAKFGGCTEVLRLLDRR